MARTVPDLDREWNGPPPSSRPAARVSPRVTILPHLASGRVALVMATPQALISLLAAWWLTARLIESGAILRNGELAWMASAPWPPLGPVLAVTVVSWLVWVWSLGAALVVVADQAQGVVPRWSAALRWPRRYPWAAPALAGVVGLTLIVQLTVVVLALLGFVRASMPLTFGIGAIVIALASVDAALVGLNRRAYALIAVGTRRWPGVVHVVPQVRGTVRTAGPVVWCTAVAVVIVGMAVHRLVTDVLGVPALVAAVVVALISLVGTTIRMVAIAHDVLPDDLPVLVRVRRPWSAARRWVAASALFVLPVLAIPMIPRIGPWDGLSYREVEIYAGVTETEVEIGGDTTLVMGMRPHERWFTRCGPDDCERATDLAYVDRTVSEDGTIWEVAWDIGDELEPDLDTPVGLTLSSDGTESRQLVTGTRGELFGPSVEGRIGTLLDHAPLAIAERDGVIAVLAMGLPGTSSPLHLAVCDPQGCTSASTSVPRFGEGRWSVVAVDVGPDGTVSAVIDTARMPDDSSGIVFVHLDETGTLSTEPIPDPAGELAYSSDAGASLAIGPDGTPWVLNLPGQGDAHLIRCDDPTCAARAVTWHQRIEQGMTALVVDSSNRPLIASWWEAHGAVRLLSCPDRSCTALTEVRLWDTRSAPTGDSGEYPHVHVGIGLDDDRPVIAVTDVYRLTGGTRLIRCDAPRCGAD